VQQVNFRYGGSAVPSADGARLTYGDAALGIAAPYVGFTANSGLLSPGQAAALIARRHMHKYGTRREHFAEIAISTRDKRHPASKGAEEDTFDALRLFQRPHDR